MDTNFNTASIIINIQFEKSQHNRWKRASGDRPFCRVNLFFFCRKSVSLKFSLKLHRRHHKTSGYEFFSVILVVVETHLSKGACIKKMRRMIWYGSSLVIWFFFLLVIRVIWAIVLHGCHLKFIALTGEV